MEAKEGFVEVTGGKVWYKIVGEGSETPLITLHGGPGYPHGYLEPLEDISNERSIIYYDQLGCGDSDWVDDKSLWTVEHFVEELQQIVDSLSLQEYHLLGHSWGAALAVMFALTRPSGLKKMIFSDPYISTPIWEKDTTRLIDKLPPKIQAALKDKNSPDHQKASDEFYANYVFRLEPLPRAITEADKKYNKELYRYMWGPEEYEATGTLKNLDPTCRLREIATPVLLLCGRYDEATPETCAYFASLFSDASVKVFEHSAHFPFWNERDEYIQTVRDFLSE